MVNELDQTVTVDIALRLNDERSLSVLTQVLIRAREALRGGVQDLEVENRCAGMTKQSRVGKTGNDKKSILNELKVVSLSSFGVGGRDPNELGLLFAIWSSACYQGCFKGDQDEREALASAILCPKVVSPFPSLILRSLGVAPSSAVMPPLYSVPCCLS